MTDQTQIQANAAVDAPAKVVKALTDTAVKAVTETTKTAKVATRAKTAKRASTARKAKRSTKRIAKPAVAARKSRRAKTTTTRTAARKTAAAINPRISTMNFTPTNMFAGFDAFNGTSPFQSLFTQTGERSQEAAKKTQKVAQELTDLARANVEAIVEAGRVATEGARSIGQDAVARSREGAEQAAEPAEDDDHQRQRQHVGIHARIDRQDGRGQHAADAGQRRAQAEHDGKQPG